MQFSKSLFTRFVPFFGNKFSGLFQDSDWFFQDSKIYINPLTAKISMIIFLTICHTCHIFILEFNRFPELSRTSSLFPGLSSPGKCHKKIPGHEPCFHFETKLINAYHGAFGSSKECRALRETLLPGLPLKTTTKAIWKLWHWETWDLLKRAGYGFLNIIYFESNPDLFCKFIPQGWALQ